MGLCGFLKDSTFPLPLFVLQLEKSPVKLYPVAVELKGAQEKALIRAAGAGEGRLLHGPGMDHASGPGTRNQRKAQLRWKRGG